MKHEKKRNANDKAAGTPVRITMKSSRRETQARLFEAIFGDGDGSGYLGGGDLTRLSPAEELMMGILSEDRNLAQVTMNLRLPRLRRRRMPQTGTARRTRSLSRKVC